jgi:uncharacterized protein (DUF2141 family)
MFPVLIFAISSVFLRYIKTAKITFMKKVILYAAIAGIYSLLTGFSDKEKKNLCVTITNIKGNGLIRSALYKPTDNFLKYTPIGYIADPKGQNSVTITITDLPYGEYAFVLFHDRNGDEKLNTKIFGIPSEPFGFSNINRAIFSAPKFDRCKFSYNEQNNCITIKLLSY